MLRPAVVEILKNNESYYSLVIAVAKRAREITDEAFEKEVLPNSFFIAFSIFSLFSSVKL